MSDTDPGLPVTERDAGNFWRGSPELLAHVARTAVRAVSRDGQGGTTCSIDIEVDHDHEIFSSPDTFLELVTREALRDFRTIELEARATDLVVSVRLHWRRPWWKPGGLRGDGPVSAFGQAEGGMDAEVALSVHGRTEPVVKAAAAEVGAALHRGGIKGGERAQVLVTILVLGLTVAAFLAGTVSLFFLLGQWHDSWLIASSVVAIAAGAVLGAWMYPSLEVAPRGETRIWRASKYIAAVVGTLVVTALGKAVFQ